MQNHILLIEGQDQAGLIAKITQTIFELGLNIIRNDEFVEEKTSRFYMRSEFTGHVTPEELMIRLKGILPTSFQIRLTPKQKKKIVVLATKEYHCLADLLVRHEFNTLNADILCVIANYPDLGPLVQKFGIPFYYISHKEKSREDHEQEILNILDKYNPEFIITAKFMRILTPEFVDKYAKRIINIHHSFLPAFVGANPYEQAFQRGVKIIGATAHFVTAGLDQGPIIIQELLPVNHRMSIADMQHAGQDAEVLALAKALKLVFEDRVFINGNKTIIFE
jgi:formyltetrahydrofolate deformylase